MFSVETFLETVYLLPQHFPEQSADSQNYIYKQPFNPLIGVFCSLTPNEMNSYKHLKLSQALAPVLQTQKLKVI